MELIKNIFVPQFDRLVSLSVLARHSKNMAKLLEYYSKAGIHRIFWWTLLIQQLLKRNTSELDVRSQIISDPFHFSSNSYRPICSSSKGNVDIFKSISCLLFLLAEMFHYFELKIQLRLDNPFFECILEQVCEISQVRVLILRVTNDMNIEFLTCRPENVAIILLSE